MTENEIQIWKSTIQEVLFENEAPESRHKSERYNVNFKEFKLPPKVALRRTLDFIEENHLDIDTETERKIRGGVPTNQFFEELGFTITEDLIYNETDYKKLSRFIDNKIEDKELFQGFINFGSEILSQLDIEVYKVRMAIESGGDLSIIVGMRAAYSYSEKEGFTQIGFLASNNFYKENKQKYDFVYNYPYKGDPPQQFIKLKIKNWSEIDQELLN